MLSKLHSLILVRFEVLLQILVLYSLDLSLKIDGGRLEAVLQPLLLEVLADDDEEALALLARLPLHVRRAVEEHADAVEDKLVLLALDGEEALHAVDVLALLHEDGAQELVR